MASTSAQPADRSGAVSNVKGALPVQMQKVIVTALPESTPICELLRDHGIHEKLAAASDDELEDAHRSGEKFIVAVFGYVLAQLIPEDRPQAHYNALKDRILSRETRAAVMTRVDYISPGTDACTDSSRIQALRLFFAYLCKHGGIEAGAGWFRQVFGGSILAADKVFIEHMDNAVPAIPQPTNPTPPVVTRYRNEWISALALLSPSILNELGPGTTGGASSSNPSADSQLQTPTCDPASHDVLASDVMVGGEVEVGEAVVSSTQTVDEEPRGLTKLLGAVFSNVVEHEGKQLYGIAQTDGVLAMAVAVPRVFASGAISAILNRKRKADVEENEVVAGPNRRRKLNPEAAPRATDPSVFVPPAVPNPTSDAPPTDSPGPSSAPVRVEGPTIPIARRKIAPPSGPSVAKAVRRIDSLTELQPAAAAAATTPPPPAVPGTHAPFDGSSL
ncbi:hypothetical protein C8R46DRAFT_1302121 [Mycena filopes]|nr:hypothetical protein C8R46DRAFT_1302121 [Mycena filopes]